MNQFFKEFLKGFKSFSEATGYPLIVVILSIVYFITIPISKLIAKIKGVNLIKKNLSKENSYWEVKKIEVEEIENYLRQF